MQMYTFDSRIRYSECDSEGFLTMESLLDYFQDCTTFQSEDLGVGTGYLKENHKAWVLNNWQIIMDKPPKIGDQVRVGTFAYEMKGFLGYRNFVLEARDGTRLAYANSLWTYLDTDQMRPTRVPEEMIALYGMEPKLEMEYAPRKIVAPREGRTGEEILIHPYHLDTNHHVNNGQYIRMAAPFLPDAFRVHELRAEFKKAALLGDVICPLAVQEPGQVTVALNDRQGNSYCMIQFL